MNWNLRLGGTSSIYFACLPPYSVQCYLWVIWCTYLKTAHDSKTPDRRVIQIEIWDSGLLEQYTFDLLVFNVILGSFIALVTKQPAAQKRLALERKRLKFGMGVLMENMWVPWTLECSRWFWSHLVHVLKWALTPKHSKKNEIWESWLLKHICWNIYGVPLAL